uniref:Alpha-1,4-glucan:maltose-1-phosphate maltosyltransferase n=1 Tax=Talaromyces marneffei PM1 TaxID=1077442 RepID=A0A093UYH6_TALMA
METPKGAPEAAGVPNSTGDGMGESQAPEPSLLFPKPSSGWGGSVATEQHLAEALQGSLQEQLAPGNASAGLERSLISGLTGAMRASSNEPIEAASSKQTGSNPHKRAGPILGDEEDQANVPFAIRMYCSELTRRFEERSGEQEKRIRALEGQVQFLVTANGSLEATVRALEAHDISVSSVPDVMVSESPPRPEAGKGLAPVPEGLAPAAKGLVTSLSGCQDPPQYQALRNYQKQAISTPTVPRNIAKS